MKSTQLMYLTFCGLLLALFSGCQDKPLQQDKVPFVMVAQAQDHQDRVSSYAGEIQARQHTALAFRVGGQITQRYVDVGDRVRQGQVLAELDVKDARLQRDSAKAQLENAQAAAKVAQDELKRFEQLLPINAVSRSQFDVIKNQHQAAQAQLKQAQASYEVANNQTQYNRLMATKNGVITQRDLEVGQVVAAGQAVYQLAIDGERDVVIGVPEQTIQHMKVGQSAWVSLWQQPEQRLNARVREISPAADQSRTFRVKVAVDASAAQLNIGQSARVFFQQSQQDQLYIPLTSISAQDQQPYVYVVKADSRVHKTPVRVGEYDRDSVSILSGLKPNDWVVVGGVHLLQDQQKIQPIDRDNQPVRFAQTTAQ